MTTEPADKLLIQDDLERIALWAKGYRRLMKGGLDPQVHAAHTEQSEMADGNHAYLMITDIEQLLRLADEGALLFKRAELALSHINAAKAAFTIEVGS